MVTWSAFHAIDTVISMIMRGWTIDIGSQPALGSVGIYEIFIHRPEFRSDRADFSGIIADNQSFCQAIDYLNAKAELWEDGWKITQKLKKQVESHGKV